MRLTLLYLALLGHAAAFSTCPDSENAAGISSIDLVPDLPTPGEITSITIDMVRPGRIITSRLSFCNCILPPPATSPYFELISPESFNLTY
jgi:hypothetical protein